MDKKYSGFCMLVSLLFIVAVLLPLEGRSEIYKYVDKNGTIHYVDDLSKVPAEYSNQITVQEEKPAETSGGETPPANVDKSENKSETPEETRTRQMLKSLEEKKRQDEEKAQAEFEQGLVTKVTIRGTTVLVPVTIGYGGKEVQASLVLDTGAYIIALNRSIADQLTITSTQRSAARVAGGKVINASIAKLDYVRVGAGPYGPEVKDIQADIISTQGPPTGNDGLLGMNFLQCFDYTIDFDNQVIKWKLK